MRFTAPKKEVEKSINVANSIISNKPQNYILTNILLEADSDSIQVTATDLDVGIKTSFPANIEESGSITINGEKFLGAIKSAIGEDISFKIEENDQIKINENTKAVFTLKGVPKENFPSVPLPAAEDVSFSIPQKDLQEMIKMTLFSISQENSRQYLNGIYFETENNTLRLVSTDGRRLALVEREFSFNEQIQLHHIVPKKILDELVRFLSDEGEVNICFTENQAFFSFDGILFTTNLIVGNFPNYNQVIPKEQNKRVVLDKSTFTEALRRSGLFVEKNRNQVRIDLSENHLIVSIANQDHGSLRDELAVEYSGEPIEVAFNFHYLQDFFKEIASDKVIMELNTPLSPVSLQIEEEPKYVYIVMPMKA